MRCAKPVYRRSNTKRSRILVQSIMSDPRCRTTRRIRSSEGMDLIAIVYFVFVRDASVDDLVQGDNDDASDLLARYYVAGTLESVGIRQ